MENVANTIEREGVNPRCDYYEFHLAVSPEGRVTWDAFSHFVDFTDDTNRFEIREPSIVNAEFVVTTERGLGRPCMVVNDDRAFDDFITLGGRALIERSVAEKHLAHLLRPAPVARSGVLGFRGLHSIPEAALRHAPTPKQRLRILKRDRYRCRLCGERPADNVHIKLHVHHIYRWARGGLTEDWNLITLCQTCHDGLEPHEDQGLFELLPGGSIIEFLEASRCDRLDGVRRYRELIRRER